MVKTLLIVFATGLLIALLYRGGEKDKDSKVSASADDSRAEVRAYLDQVKQETKEIHDQSEWLRMKDSTDPSLKALIAVVENMDASDACRAWGKELRSPKKTKRQIVLREYLLHHNSLNGIDLLHARGRGVAVGMTACGVYASIGLLDDSNWTTTAHRTSVQMVYRDKGMYVYTEAAPNNFNGLVTAVQH